VQLRNELSWPEDNRDSVIDVASDLNHHLNPQVVPMEGQITQGSCSHPHQLDSFAISYANMIPIASDAQLGVASARERGGERDTERSQMEAKNPSKISYLVLVVQKK